MASTTLTRIYDGRTTGRRRERVRRYAACRRLICAVALLVVAVLVVGTPMVQAMAQLALLVVAGCSALGIAPPMRRIIAAPVAARLLRAALAVVAAMPASRRTAALVVVAIRAIARMPRAAADAARVAIGVVAAAILPRTTTRSLSHAA